VEEEEEVEEKWGQGRDWRKWGQGRDWRKHKGGWQRSQQIRRDPTGLAAVQSIDNVLNQNRTTSGVRAVASVQIQIRGWAAVTAGGVSIACVC
jgi:hypothetical protein